MGFVTLAHKVAEAKKPVTGLLLSTIAEGSLVKLNESGSPVEFYVAKHDYEQDLNGAGRTLLVRKAICQLMAWTTKSGNEYDGSTIDTWQNGTYLAKLDADAQSAIATTTFYYSSYNEDYDVVTLAKPVFLLSLWELGKTNSYANKEGSTLPIASLLIPAVDEKGNDAGQWVRSAADSSTYAMRVASNGTVNRATRTAADSYGVRPCFTLPANAVFNEETLEFEGVS